MKTISLVVPFYNEEEVVDKFFERVVPLVGKLAGYSFEIVCVNDGSTDNTLPLLLKYLNFAPPVKVVIIDFSRNFGKEAALTAGIENAIGAAVVPIDADLQDPPELIAEMLLLWEQGFEVVLAKRTDRALDAPLKRITSRLFYKFFTRLSDTKIPPNVGDFRLMDRMVVDSLKRLPERRRFMKGLFAWVGFKTTELGYAREQRSAGKTKFNGWKLWNFALEGITSFSTLPLRVWMYTGTLVAGGALIYAVYIILKTLIKGIDVPGYASVLVAILFLGGIQLIGIGIIGEYIGRLFQEAKCRPIYIVRKKYD